MMTESIELFNEQETKALGKQIAKKFFEKPGLIFLRGDLGAGKTTFAQGFIETLLKNTHSILSPTYAYMHYYEGEIPIYHFDLYRIENADCFHHLGLESFIDDENALRLIEWPERLETVLPTPDMDITLLHANGHRKAKIREINLTVA